jgi:hypothetical protein
LALTLPSFLQPRPLPTPSFLASAVAWVSPDATGDEIDFTMLHQEATNWCWAAVTQAVLFYLDENRFIKQARIATDHIRRTQPNITCVADQGEVAGGTCDNVCNKPCNGFHKVRVVIQENGVEVGVLRAESPVRFEDVVSEIGRRRPVVCRIAYEDSSGHFVCLTGWRVRGGVRSVRVHDPRAGSLGRKVPSSWLTLDEFIHYSAGGAAGLNNYSYRVG